MIQAPTNDGKNDRIVLVVSDMTTAARAHMPKLTRKKITMGTGLALTTALRNPPPVTFLGRRYPRKIAHKVKAAIEVAQPRITSGCLRKRRTLGTLNLIATPFLSWTRG